MKKILVLIGVLLGSVCTNAQIPIIGTIISEVVKEFDIQIQRLQNETLWMQNIQKNIENNLNKLKLDEIRNWSARQKTLYQDYFAELQTVKTVVSQFSAAKGVVTKELAIVNEYSRAYALVRSGNYFSVVDQQYIETFYEGLLERSLAAIDQLQLATPHNGSQMNDASRLGIINKASEVIDKSLSDLRGFNQKIADIIQQKDLARTNNTIIQKLYGL